MQVLGKITKIVVWCPPSQISPTDNPESSATILRKVKFLAIFRGNLQANYSVQTEIYLTLIVSQEKTCLPHLEWHPFVGLIVSIEPIYFTKPEEQKLSRSSNNNNMKLETFRPPRACWHRASAMMLALKLQRNTLISIALFARSVSVGISTDASVKIQMCSEPIQSVKVNARCEHSLSCKVLKDALLSFLKIK